MKILKLTIKKKWFDMILSGEKKEEYREIKKLYINKFNRNTFTHVQFYNGGYYGNNLPNILMELNAITKGFGWKVWGAGESEVFILRLGFIIKKNNIRK